MRSLGSWIWSYPAWRLRSGCILQGDVGGRDRFCAEVEVQSRLMFSLFYALAEACFFELSMATCINFDQS